MRSNNPGSVFLTGAWITFAIEVQVKHKLSLDPKEMSLPCHGLHNALKALCTKVRSGQPQPSLACYVPCN